ncbi:MAG: hypothetical protein OET90_03495 [Desulfuromonadales bacterium]|nr:hypothetical protein [Desulfuromonadales bacterium]
MRTSACISDENLTLLYYGETEQLAPEISTHLGSCYDCRQRLNLLQTTLGKLPQLEDEACGATSTRIAAAVSERLQRKQRSWRPVWGGGLVTAASLLLALLIWRPSAQIDPIESAGTDYLALHAELTLLEDFELLTELELLQELEGI